MKARAVARALVVLAPWAFLLLIDLVLRFRASNNAVPSQWSTIDAGVYFLGSLWSLTSWFLLQHLLGRLRARRPRLTQSFIPPVAAFFATLALLSFAYRLYYYQSPSWQVIKFMASEPENTKRIVLAALHPAQVLVGLLLVLGLARLLLHTTSRIAVSPPPWPRWAWALMAVVYLTNSALTLFTAGFQDPLPVESNTAAAFAQFGVAVLTRNRHLVAPLRPEIPPQTPRPRPSVLLIVHESLREDVVFPGPMRGEAVHDARKVSPYSSRLPDRRADGFFVFPRARANASATEASLPTILSGLDLGGSPDAYGRVHTVWSLGKATGAKTWLYSAQTYAWSHFDEYFFDRNLDLARTGLDLAPAYVNDVGVDDVIPVDRALEQIAAHQRAGERWLGVVHFSGTHVPGYPGPGVEPSTNEHERCRQAAHYIDQVVEKLVEGVLHSDAASNTFIVSTSDHGEPLESQRKMRRLGSHYEEVVRVPMWVWIPPKLAAEHPEWVSALEAWQPRNVQNVQLLGTVRDALLMDDSPELNDHIWGPSLLRPPGDRPDIVVGQSTCSFRNWWQEGVYLVNGDMKFVLSNERPGPELYDVAADPPERVNLWNDEARRAEALRWAIPRLQQGAELTAACRRIGKNCILP